MGRKIIYEEPVEEEVIAKPPVVVNKDVEDDYAYARAKYYSLAEKGDEAIEMMLDLARESESPRAFEVLSGMLRQNAETVDRLMDLQKRKREVDGSTSEGNKAKSLTQNNVYIGSTTDLQRMLLKEINGESSKHD